MILSVDPGVHFHGCALWEGGELASAWLSPSGELSHLAIHSRDALGVDILVIEIPQIYAIRRSKGGVKGQNDLVNLAFSAGQLAGQVDPERMVLYRPREWKGQVPKDIMIERIQDKLSPEEHKRVELPRARSKAHNVWDGIGIGLFYWGRL